MLHPDQKQTADDVFKYVIQSAVLLHFTPETACVASLLQIGAVYHTSKLSRIENKWFVAGIFIVFSTDITDLIHPFTASTQFIYQQRNLDGFVCSESATVIQVICAEKQQWKDLKTCFQIYR